MEYFIALKQVLKPAHVHQARKHTDLNKCNLCGFIVCVCVYIFIYTRLNMVGQGMQT